MSDTNGTPTLAQQLREESERRVTIGDHEFTIRFVARDELMATGVFGPVLAHIAEGSDRRELVRHMKGSEMADIMNATIRAGLVEPRIWTGTPEECPPDRILLGQLGRYREPVYHAIMEFSGWAVEVAQAAAFPDADGAGAGLPPTGPDGEPHPVGSAADGDR